MLKHNLGKSIIRKWNAIDKEFERDYLALVPNAKRFFLFKRLLPDRPYDIDSDEKRASFSPARYVLISAYTPKEANRIASERLGMKLPRRGRRPLLKQSATDEHEIDSASQLKPDFEWTSANLTDSAIKEHQLLDNCEPWIFSRCMDKEGFPEFQTVCIVEPLHEFEAKNDKTDENMEKIISVTKEYDGKCALSMRTYYNGNVEFGVIA